MITAAKIECYACETLAGRTAVVLQNLYDGEYLVMHRHCILRVVEKVAEHDEDLAAQFHFHLRPLFRAGDAAVRERRAGALRRPMYSMVAFSTDELMAEEPVVPQNPIGYRPDLDDDEEAPEEGSR